MPQGETSTITEEVPLETMDKSTDNKTGTDKTGNEDTKTEERKKKLEKKKEDVAVSLEGLAKDTENRSKSMDQTKDRTQMATATSMFIVHVGILRTVVTNEDVQYYEIQIGFVLTALALQLVAGIISLYIAIIRHYYSEHHGDCTEDCSKICLPCSCIPAEQWDQERNACSTVDLWVQDVDEEPKPEVIASSRCCPYHFLCHQYELEEREILIVYKNWQEEMIKSKLRAVMSDEEEENRDMLDLQGEILKGYVQEIRKNKILRRATFWQNVMGLVVFFVFVLNALFTGFGMISVTGTQ